MSEDHKRQLEQQLWFCMYEYSEWEVQIEIIHHILSHEIGPDFPYPGFYTNLVETIEIE